MISSSNKEDDRPLPDQILAVAPQPPFTFPVVPLRKMAIANSSTKMARLKANLEAVGGNTHVETPQKWKERGLEGEAIAELTRGEGKLDPNHLGHHQKLIIGEATSANTYYLQAALRSCLIDARTSHAGLSNQAKARLVDKFNDPKDPLKCLIMMYDVDAVGLNLHH
ncbi:hypothetical protein KCU71_g11578, partial [Aureobasidium melanogenum]